MPDVVIDITERQSDFINVKADEVLFGGAAGGGKSFGQLIDIMQYALTYPGSKQIIFRKSFPELERTLIMTSQEIYPKDIYSYTGSRRRGRFKNGSMVEFAYLDKDADVTNYQSAEYDVIRFDELTHFSEYVYTYMISRLRGVQPFPRSIKSSSNPGGIGHAWVKERFINIGDPNVVHSVEIDGSATTRVFLPSKLDDNPYLTNNDPGYEKRLKNLRKAEYLALRYGDWDVFEGQYFTCWDEDLHVIKPFKIPDQWPRYFAMDYGLDMFAGYWIATDYDGRSYVYREVYMPGLVIKDAALKIKELSNGEFIHQYIAPPDMWNKRQETGKNAADIFFEYGIPLSKSSNDRISGWHAMNNELLPRLASDGMKYPNIVFFNTCPNVIRCIPLLITSKDNPNDVSKTPHDITHAPDAIRYYVSARTPAAEVPIYEEDVCEEDQQIQELVAYGW